MRSRGCAVQYWRMTLINVIRIFVIVVIISSGSYRLYQSSVLSQAWLFQPVFKPVCLFNLSYVYTKRLQVNESQHAFYWHVYHRSLRFISYELDFSLINPVFNLIARLGGQNILFFPLIINLYIFIMNLYNLT